MVDPRIHRALTAAGVFLLLAYGTGLAWALARVGTDADAGLGPLAAATGPKDGQRAYYRVTTPNGEQHVIDVDPLDAANVLLTAGERYGEGVTVARIAPAEAQAARRPAAGELGAAPWLWLTLPILLIPAWFLLAARKERRRCTHLCDLWERVSRRLGYPAEGLMAEVGIGERELRDSLTVLNERLGTELLWDAPSGQVVDARLSHFSLVLMHCPRCNAATRARVRADLLAPPKCTACMLPFEGQELEHQRAKIVARLLSDDPGGPQRPSPRRFSLLYFALWTLVFPPVAIVYAHGSAK